MNGETFRYWALVGHNLTIVARETYVPQTDEIAEPAKLKGYNEMLHRICSYLAQNGVTEQDDSWLVKVLLEMSEHYDIVAPVKWALGEAGNGGRTPFV